MSMRVVKAEEPLRLHRGSDQRHTHTRGDTSAVCSASRSCANRVPSFSKVDPNLSSDSGWMWNWMLGLSAYLYITERRESVEVVVAGMGG